MLFHSKHMETDGNMFSFFQNLMWLTVHRAMQQIGIFLSFFTTIYLAYVFAGHLMFGPEVYEFSTFALSLRSMLFIILGQYRYSDLKRVNQYLAPMFVISYVALVGYGERCCCVCWSPVWCMGSGGLTNFVLFCCFVVLLVLCWCCVGVLLVLLFSCWV